MKKDNPIIDVSGVNNRTKFITSLLSYYASIEVIFTIWGKIPKEIYNKIKIYKAPSTLRQYIFRESNWHLNNNSLSHIIENLCIDDILESLSWGILKDSTSLAFARNWDDINLHSSSFISDSDLINLLNDLKANQIIERYEIITD